MTISALTGQPFPRGAIPTPRHKLQQAVPHLVLFAPPPQFGVAPKNLNMEGNDQYGDCVSAEEAFAKAVWSLICGLAELMPTAAECIAFARQYGYLNGANLTDVMDTMKSRGMSIGGKLYYDGNYAGVDYSNETTLQSAITVGPVKVAIDANALPSGAGNRQGWVAVGGSPNQFPNTDHCICYFGYGPATFLFGLLGLSVPSGLSATKTYYLAYTWATIGVVDHDWIMSTTTEGWVRSPTTPGQVPTPTPTPPTPPPTPTPTPPGPVGDMNLQISAHLTPPHGMLGTYTLTPVSVPVPKELVGMNVPWYLLWLIAMVPKLMPIILADIAAKKTWLQIWNDLAPIIFGPQLNMVPQKPFHAVNPTATQALAPGQTFVDMRTMKGTKK